MKRESYRFRLVSCGLLLTSDPLELSADELALQLEIINNENGRLGGCLLAVQKLVTVQEWKTI